MALTLNEYQNRAADFAVYGGAYLYPFFALSEEAGEVSGKIAKYAREHQEIPDFLDLTVQMDELREKLKKELGDVLWNLSLCADELGYTLEEIAEDNIRKLESRKKRAVLVGEGDDR